MLIMEKPAIIAMDVKGEAAGKRISPINMRELVFGFNDGLVSTFAFVAGLFGAGLQNASILLVGLIGAFSAALSMGFGAWLSTKSENEMYDALLKEKQEELGKETEMKLEEYLKGLGLEGRTLTDAKKAIIRDKKHYAKIMVRDVEGLENSRTHSPLRDSIFMFLAFVFGAIFPLLSYALGLQSPFAYSIAFSFSAAFMIGAIKTRFTRVSWIKSGMETLMICLLLVTVAYLSGMLIESLMP
jgi:vacuolar iron transporter family protein